jgi:hypothetical protein
LGQLSSGLYPGGAGQVDVHEHDVERRIGKLLECVFGAVGGTYVAHVGQGGKQPGQSVTEDRVIVDDEQTGHA